MRLLDRYLLRELIVPFSYCLIGFVIFWVSFDLFAQLADFQKLRLRAGDILEYYMVTAPGILVTILPMAFLLALLYALTNHARHHELTAMRAAGISLGRLSVPYFAIGFLLSLAVLAMSQLWVPESHETVDRIMARHHTEKVAGSKRGEWEPKLGFYNYLKRRWWIVEKYHLFTGEMIRPHIIWILPDGTRREIIAEHGHFANGAWAFQQVHQLTYAPTPGVLPTQEDLDSLEVPEFEETPDRIRSEIKIGKLNSLRSMRKTQLSIQEIREYQRLHPFGITPELQAVLETKLHGQLAAPWTCLVVVAIALPFGARPGRRNVAVGVASSIFICFAYFVLRELSLAVGSGGHTPAWVAAWVPNVLFGLTGLVLSWRLR